MMLLFWRLLFNLQFRRRICFRQFSTGVQLKFQSNAVTACVFNYDSGPLYFQA